MYISSLKLYLLTIHKINLGNLLKANFGVETLSEIHASLNNIDRLLEKPIKISIHLIRES